MHIRTVPVLLALTAAALATPAAQQPSQPPGPAVRSGGQATPDQQPPITFKVEVNYVEIDASVTDAQGAFVRGLTKDDFLITEDRKPQSVSIFSIVDIPVERPDPPLFARTSIEPDVRTNENAFNGRVFVIVLDDLHTLAQRSQLVRAAARQFVDRYVGANDEVAIVQTGGNAGGSQDFTNSTPRLDRAIDGFVGRKLRSATLEKIDDYNRQRMMGGNVSTPKDTSDLERAYQARSTLETLKGVAEYLTGVRGRRKAVVYFGEGIDYDITNVFDNQSAGDVMQQTKDAIAAATRSNVSFYTVDARGLGGLSDEMMEMSNLPEDNSIGPQTLQAELRISQDSLRVLADQTGGIAVVNHNDFRDAFTRIIQDNSRYYVLGYYTNEKRDGRFRSVDVRVRRPGLQVRARRGYIAPSGRPAASKNAVSTAPNTSPELHEVLNSPVPVSGLALRVFAAPFKGTPPDASVALTVQVDGSNLKFKEENGLFFDDVELSFMALDQGGKARSGGRDIINLRLRPQTHEAVLRNGVNFERRIQLAPGRYQLRVGARETGGGTVGSVLYDLDVPDFSREPLAMSGVVVSSAANRVPALNADPDLKAVLPGQPTAERVFPPGDTLAVFADVYDNRNDVAHRVTIRTSVLSEDGKVVYTTADERHSEELQGAKGGGYGYTAQVPLAGAAPGRYVLRVDAESSLGSHPKAKRELEFRIQ